MLKRGSKDVISDSEISRVAATHPKVDILILLSQSDYDPYRLVNDFRRCTGVRNQLQYFIVYLLKASKGERRDAFQAGIIPAPQT